MSTRTFMNEQPVNPARRQFLGGAVAGAAAILPKPAHSGGLYVHTWAERLVPLTGGGFGSETIQVDEGPFTLEEALARMRQIGTAGLEIGTYYFPVHRVHQVQLRQQ
jgi:hypothetical protein